MPSTQGANIHVIGAISDCGPELVTVRHGAFRWEAANEWVEDLCSRLEARGVPASRVVLVCDNAPCHSRVGQVAEKRGFELLRLGPYSPMLNPIENVWSAVKAAVKRCNVLPVLTGPAQERRQYLEGAIQEAIQGITPLLCVQVISHSRSFHGPALALEDMPVGC